MKIGRDVECCGEGRQGAAAMDPATESLDAAEQVRKVGRRVDQDAGEACAACYALREFVGP